MFELIKKLIGPDDENSRTIKITSGKRLQIATCALFIEIARADSNFDETERKKIISVMKKLFDLEEDYVKELLDLASESVNKSISLYDFTPVINDNFSPAEKYDLLKYLWHLVYVDNELDKYEEHLVKRIGKMLNVEYKDIVAAKLQVKAEVNK